MTTEDKPNYSVQARWTERLGKRFCPVSSVFLANYHRLRPHENARGLNSTEAMLVIQILDHKWTTKAPWPSVPTLAKRLGISTRAVRAALKSLEDGGWLRREYRNHGTNLFHFDGLFAALEALMDADNAQQAVANDNLPQAA